MFICPALVHRRVCIYVLNTYTMQQLYLYLIPPIYYPRNNAPGHITQNEQDNFRCCIALGFLYVALINSWKLSGFLASKTRVLLLVTCNYSQVFNSSWNVPEEYFSDDYKTYLPHQRVCWRIFFQAVLLFLTELLQVIIGVRFDYTECIFCNN